MREIWVHGLRGVFCCHVVVQNVLWNLSNTNAWNQVSGLVGLVNVKRGILFVGPQCGSAVCTALCRVSWLYQALSSIHLAARRPPNLITRGQPREHWTLPKKLLLSSVLDSGWRNPLFQVHPCSHLFQEVVGRKLLESLDIPALAYHRIFLV